jgi:hypothetical protein
MTLESLNEYFPKELSRMIEKYTHPELNIVGDHNYTFIYYTVFGDARALKTLRVLSGIIILFDSINGYSMQHRILNEINRLDLWALSELDRSRIISIINNNDREILIS